MFHAYLWLMSQEALPEAVRAKLDALARQHDDLEAQLVDPEVLADHRRVRELSIQKSALEPVARGYRRYQALLAEARELEAAAGEGDAELAAMVSEEVPLLRARADEMLGEVKARLVTAEDDRIGSVILEVRAGTGGDEATLWARDLIDVYTKYAAKRGWKIETLDLTGEPSVGGIRHAVLSMSGESVWTEMAFEAGVHSVKRVPATEAQGRIHTSTATVATLPEPQEVEVRIDWEKDVREDLTTAQGPGGQNVNKVVTACKLLHLPTGIEVRMQESKSLQMNREKARRLLMARLYDLERRKAEAARAAERREQIGTGERSEKIRVYRYQDGIVADQRLDEKFALRDVLAGDLGPLFRALVEQETNRRLAAL